MKTCQLSLQNFLYASIRKLPYAINFRTARIALHYTSIRAYFLDATNFCTLMNVYENTQN